MPCAWLPAPHRFHQLRKPNWVIPSLDRQKLGVANLPPVRRHLFGWLQLAARGPRKTPFYSHLACASRSPRGGLEESTSDTLLQRRCATTTPF